MRPTLDKAGKYPVVQIPCPSFTESVRLDAPRAGVLHTTEGGWDGGMGVFHVHFAPQFLVGVNATHHAARRFGMASDKPPVSGSVEIAQLVPVGRIGAALVHHNDLAIVQIETVAYSKETPWIFDDPTLDALAALMATCEAEYGIPLTRPWPDSVWGRAGNTAHRNDGHFGKTAGWYAHGDIPSPDTHWDCGALEWSKLFARANALKGA